MQSAGTKIAGTRPAVNGGVRIITVELNRLRDYYGKSKSDNTVRPYRARCARWGSIRGAHAIPYKRDESEAIMGNVDRRGTASFVSVSGGKYDIMASQPERESA